MKTLQISKKKICLSISLASLSIISSCSSSGTSIKAAPESLAPIVEAVTSSTYASWETASDVFSAGSSAEKKWSALKMQQKALFEKGDSEALYYWTASEKDGWDILKFCSDQIVDNECSDYDKSPEVHVRSVNGKVSELRWFEDAADETGSQPELLVYEVSSSNPGFGAAQFSIESAITRVNQSGKTVSCYYGGIELDAQIRKLADEVYLPVLLYMSAETSDGVSLEATLGTSGIIDTSRVDEPIPFVACYEYPASEIERLIIEAGKFRITVLDSTPRNTSDISISLTSRSL